MVKARRRPLLALGLMALALTACKSNGGGRTSPVPETRRAELIRSLVDHVLIPSLDQLVAAVEDFETAAAAYAADVESAESREALEAAFGALLEALQRVEVLQVGPLADPAKAAGGQGLRYQLYSWPLHSRCSVDMAIVDESYVDVNALAAMVPSHFGLDAAEYLLFHPADTNACPSINRINGATCTGPSTCFAAVVTDGLLPSRAATYLARVAELLARDARAVRDAYARNAGNFVAQLEAGSGVYRDTTESMTAFIHGMYYVEIEVKDLKLAIPIGVSDSCSTATCPSQVELPYSGRSKEAILANLRAFRDLYLGGDPAVFPSALGFDDILVELGAADVDTAMRAAIDATISSVDAIPGTLEGAIVSDLASVEVAYAALQLLMTEFKTRFIAILDVQPPAAAAGDND
jgi:uncharacterized protein